MWWGGGGRWFVALGIKTVLRSLRVMGEQGRPPVSLGVKRHQPNSAFRAEKQGRAHSARDVTARRSSPSLPSINIFGPICPLLRAWLLGVLLLLGGSVHAQETENQPPVVEYQLFPEWLRMGVSDAVSVGYGFEDPDDDPLTYTASSDNEAVVEVESVMDNVVTLMPKVIGTATITVTATDTGGSNTSVEQDFTVTVLRNYDTDSDGLIEITTLAQLDAIRHDLDGDSRPAYGTDTAYAEAFLEGGVTERGRLTCSGACKGYELKADLDFFDTNEDGQVDTNDDTNGDGQVDAEDNTTYWNEGAGWMPIGEDGAFSTTFDGNGHTIRNLFIKREDAFATGLAVGLFNQIDSPGELRNVGVIDVDVTGGKLVVGGLVGSISSGGSITASYVTGRVVGMHNIVGGLAGANNSGSITASYFTGHVEGKGTAVGGLAGTSSGRITDSYATGQVVANSHAGGLVGISSGHITSSYSTACVVVGNNDAGGLIGANRGSITSSYATGPVAGRTRVGGLVGWNEGSNSSITASYATGHVMGNTWVGGLVGSNEGTITASYWDTDTSGRDVGVGTDDADDNGIIDGTESQTAGVAGKTTAQLQEPTDYTGIYDTWNDMDLDGDGNNNAPWDFGEDDEYPVLLVDFDGDETATWQEFGYQFRESMVLTATMPLEGVARVDLAWTEVAVDHWDPEPDVTYILLRDDGTTVETLSENTAAGDYSDLSVVPGSTYTYRVAVVVMGSETTCTGVSVTIPADANRHPQVSEELDDLPLQVGQPDYEVDVDEVFEDPDGDTLTYGATSSADTVVEVVSVTGTMVTLRPLAVGTATITVTVTDTGGLSATQQFLVTVTSPPPPDTNTPPPDTNTPPPDTNTPPPDTNTPPPDTNTPPPDTNTPPPDTNTPPPDTNTPPPDTNTPPPNSGSLGPGSRSVSRASTQRSPAGHLEIPGPNSVQSGIGVISGWICEAKTVEIEVEIDGDTHRLPAAYGTDRADTKRECGDMDNGFGLLFNWNLLGDGEHTVAVLVDRNPWRRLRVRVTTLGEEFVKDVAGMCEAVDFPHTGKAVTLVWQEAQQNFVITDGSEPPVGDPALRGEPLGFLENPAPNSFQSGIGVISGWICEAKTVDIEINGTHRLMAAYGTDRADTEYTEEGEELCGDTDNGFGLLFNWNLLDAGEHTVVALVDGEPWRRATVRVTTLGEEFVKDVAGMCEVAAFPSPGESVTLRWQEAKQNFVITAIE